MKHIKHLLFLPFVFSLSAAAQTYKIDTSEISFENKLRPCFTVKYDADARTVKKAWSDFLKKNYRIKTKGVGLFSDKDIVSSEDVTIGSISDKRMNIYVRVTDEATGSELKYFMSFGYDFFIGRDNYPAEFGSMKKLLNDFSVEFLNDYYASEASRITKKVKGLEKDIKSKKKAISKNEKKAKKESAAVASGLEAKNKSLETEIKELERQIDGFAGQLDVIKVKQSGITRN